MTDQKVQIQLRVRPNDLDSLGHVNNAVVLEYLEAARWAWQEAQRLARGGPVTPVVARIEVDYRREIRAEDLMIFAEIAEMGFYSVVFRQWIEVQRDGRPSVAVEARVQVALIDKEGRPQPVEDYLESARQ